MLAEIIYLIVGVAYIFVLVRKTPAQKAPDKKVLILSIVTIAVSAMLNMIIPSAFYAFSNADSTEKAIIVKGCMGNVLLPLIIALVSVFLINHFFQRNQKNLVVMIVLAAVCALRACLYEVKDLVDLTNTYLFNVKMLTYLPMLVKMLLSVFAVPDEESV